MGRLFRAPVLAPALVVLVVLALACVGAQRQKPLREAACARTAAAGKTDSRSSASKSHSSMERLLKQLRDKDPKVRAKASDVLGKLRDRRAVPALIRALKDSDPDVIAMAAYALGAIRDPRAIEPLIPLLGDQRHWGGGWDPANVGGSAQIVLEQFGAAAVAPLLVALRHNPSPRVRAGAASVIAVSAGQRQLPALLSSLKDPDPIARVGIVYALSAVPVAAIASPLADVLRRDESAKVRETAAVVLRHAKTRSAVKPLADAIREDPDAAVRRAAVGSLEELGFKEGAETVVAALKDRDPQVRETAVTALPRLAGSEAVGPLIQALKDSDSRVRDNAARVLGQVNDKRAVPPLIETLDDPERQVRQQAAKALGHLKDPEAVPRLLAVLDEPDMAYVVAPALGEIGDVRAVPALMNQLESKSFATKWAAAQALAKFTDPKAEAALLQSLKAGDVDVVAAAYQFFLRTSLPQAEPLLLRALARYPDPRMADAFAKSGSKSLAAAARRLQARWKKEQEQEDKQGPHLP